MDHDLAEVHRWKAATTVGALGGSAPPHVLSTDSGVAFALRNQEGVIFERWVHTAIRSPGIRSVVDVGAGAQPYIPADVAEHHRLLYTALDISQEELSKADPRYRSVCADIASPRFDVDLVADLVISRMLAEHVTDGRQFHENVLRILRPGGLAIHMFPTLWATPFVLNKWVPEGFSSALVRLFAHRTPAKFPAHYSWCFGPTRRQIERIESVGFEISAYVGVFGHGYYDRVPLLRSLHERRSRHLKAHQAARRTSYAVVALRRPSGQRLHDF